MVRFRTSSATLARLLPCSPARAGLPAALSVSRSVWNAMPSIVPSTFAVLLVHRSMSLIAAFSLPRVTHCARSRVTLAYDLCDHARIVPAGLGFFMR